MAINLQTDTLFARIPIAFFVQVSILGLCVHVFSVARIPTGIELPLLANIGITVVGLMLSKRANNKGERIKCTIANKGDMIAYAIIIFAILTLSYAQFGFELTPNFISVDAATHCMNATNIVKSGMVSSMYFTHYYDAIWMMAFSPIIDPFDYYKVFICGETSLMLFGALGFYSLVKQTGSNHRIGSPIIAISVTLIYIGGYFLNSYVSGYSYLAAGMSIIIAIVWVINRRHEGQTGTMIAALLLLMYGLAESYLLFVPVVYVAIYLTFAHELRLRGISAKRILLFSAIGFCAVVILGAIAYIQFFGLSLGALKALNINGGSYMNLFANFVVLAPIAAYGMVRDIKAKNERFLSLLAILVIAFGLIMFALALTHHASAYYFYKCHYVIWLVLCALTSHGLHHLLDANKSVLATYTATWLLVLACAMGGLDDSLTAKRPDLNSKPFSWEFFDIVHYNRLFYTTVNVTNDDLELFRAYSECLEDADNDSAFVLGHEAVMYWFQTTTGHTARSHTYWGMTDAEIDEYFHDCEYVLVSTSEYSKTCPLASKDKTSTNELISLYANKGEPVFENNAGLVVKTNDSSS